MYAKFFKRPIDFVLSLCALVALSPVLLVLTVVGAFAMRGNPFFTQLRPGKDEKIFKLIKFRTMTNRKDKDGNLLPDEQRLTKYGRILRSTSLDELPELFNILKGDMSIVGPRPLLVKYLDRYNDEQKKRHDVRPGLTGYAQANGRNALTWEERFSMDVWYTENITFWGDIRILLDTVKVVLNRDGITSQSSDTMEEFLGTQEVQQ
ncbi:MAG: sugar transferase [Ruminococcaceae bacterium]|nr:sugar transferase [Oscillospiraceae bacterium]